MRASTKRIYATRSAAFLYGLLTFPLSYLLVYLCLRLTGVYHAYYSQGSWEIEGGTNIYVIDLAYLPLVILENDMQFTMDWQKQPEGG